MSNYFKYFIQIGRIANVHKAAITSLYFMPSEPIMVSTSADNSIRTWILDQAKINIILYIITCFQMDGMPRQLVINEGHALPIQTITFR